MGLLTGTGLLSIGALYFNRPVVFQAVELARDDREQINTRQGFRIDDGYLHIDLLAHACIKISTSDCRILCDPWLLGTAFNDGWRLSPQPQLDDLELADVTHIWLSHEHPDHMHLPTLKWLAEHIEVAQVSVVSQRTNSDKIFSALRRIGFESFISVEHAQLIPLSPSVEVFVYAHRHLDSALGVRWRGENAILNLNDAELNSQDCASIRDKFGDFPVLFNQFSIAGFDGDLDQSKLQAQSRSVLQLMADQHSQLNALHTVPFASLMQFCATDNLFLNDYRNTVERVDDFFGQRGLALLPLKPGGVGLTIRKTNDSLAIDHELPSSEGRQFFESLTEVPPESVSADPAASPVLLDDLREAFEQRTASWRSHTHRFIYAKTGNINAWLPDLGEGLLLDFANCQLRSAPHISRDNAEMIVGSQPLHFAFRFPFGVQTLGVSGRYVFPRGIPGNWPWVRTISSLHNADVHLSARSMLRPATLAWIWQRRVGLVGQISQQFRRFGALGARTRKSK